MAHSQAGRRAHSRPARPPEHAPAQLRLAPARKRGRSARHSGGARALGHHHHDHVRSHFHAPAAGEVVWTPRRWASLKSSPEAAEPLVAEETGGGSGAGKATSQLFFSLDRVAAVLLYDLADGGARSRAGSPRGHRNRCVVNPRHVVRAQGEDGEGSRGSAGQGTQRTTPYRELPSGDV